MTRPIAMIVEDDPQLGWIFAKALEEHFDTEIINDGRDAFMRLDQVAPAIIVLDLNLPGMDGTDILHGIRQDARLQHSRVILCTADNHSAEPLQEIADIVMLKPVSPKQLRDIAVRLYPANC